MLTREIPKEAAPKCKHERVMKAPIKTFDDVEESGTEWRCFNCGLRFVPAKTIGEFIEEAENVSS